MAKYLPHNNHPHLTNLRSFSFSRWFKIFTPAPPSFFPLSFHHSRWTNNCDLHPTPQTFASDNSFFQTTTTPTFYSIATSQYLVGTTTSFSLPSLLLTTPTLQWSPRPLIFDATPITHHTPCFSFALISCHLVLQLVFDSISFLYAFRCSSWVRLLTSTSFSS